jgi:hypothetical protein
MVTSDSSAAISASQRFLKGQRARQEGVRGEFRRGSSEGSQGGFLLGDGLRL